MMEFTAEMIAGFLGGDIVGDKTVKVHTVSSIEEGKVGSMAYLVNPKYEPFLYTTEASHTAGRFKETHGELRRSIHDAVAKNVQHTMGIQIPVQLF